MKISRRFDMRRHAQAPMMCTAHNLGEQRGIQSFPGKIFLIVPAFFVLLRIDENVFQISNLRSQISDSSDLRFEI
jgi:hypothetical protein